MRGMGKTPIVSCQVSFYPLYTEDCIALVKEVVEIIAKSDGVSSSVNEMSTIIRGERKAVMGVLDEIQRRMEEKGVRYTMVVTLSNTCGCSIS
ncbi:MAG TPA: YkoF family thiamine/hydroxymethylpyrimidine-binding protein [Clostridia bacterium]|nr:YkoF family thiamine/hydroxymethylpyrimidine-binding protein [Clostridia bacterium]